MPILLSVCLIKTGDTFDEWTEKDWTLSIFARYYLFFDATLCNDDFELGPEAYSLPVQQP